MAPQTQMEKGTSTAIIDTVLNLIAVLRMVAAPGIAEFHDARQEVDGSDVAISLMGMLNHRS